MGDGVGGGGGAAHSAGSPLSHACQRAITGLLMHMGDQLGGCRCSPRAWRERPSGPWLLMGLCCLPASSCMLLLALEHRLPQSRALAAAPSSRAPPLRALAWRWMLPEQECDPGLQETASTLQMNAPSCCRRRCAALRRALACPRLSCYPAGSLPPHYQFRVGKMASETTSSPVALSANALKYLRRGGRQEGERSAARDGPRAPRRRHTRTGSPTTHPLHPCQQRILMMDTSWWASAPP